MISIVNGIELLLLVLRTVSTLRSANGRNTATCRRVYLVSEERRTAYVFTLWIVRPFVTEPSSSNRQARRLPFVIVRID